LGEGEKGGKKRRRGPGGVGKAPSALAIGSIGLGKEKGEVPKKEKKKGVKEGIVNPFRKKLKKTRGGSKGGPDGLDKGIGHG